MRIIENANNKKDLKFPLVVKCGHCGSKLEVERSDLYEGELKLLFYDCPVCGEKNDCFEAEDLTEDLTVDNMEFPLNFHCSNGGVDISNDEIKEYIRKGVKFFRENPNEYEWYTETGNTAIFVQNFPGDENYYVIVAKDYYSAWLNYQDIDKKIHY